ncbi:hypothetical protein SASPL_106134 [Salvia splendens]|uniref:Casein kinase II subunit beta n=1 Tax=Salvia splendens TaxID=180675 RepID=A0A8X8YQ17_SALSN|nr:hypothetical protein SASPL_106134 [Salvia splendens]
MYELKYCEYSAPRSISMLECVQGAYSESAAKKSYPNCSFNISISMVKADETLSLSAQSGEICWLRWVNYLRPGLKKGLLTPQEEGIIIELHALWISDNLSLLTIHISVLTFRDNSTEMGGCCWFYAYDAMKLTSCLFFGDVIVEDKILAPRVTGCLLHAMLWNPLNATHRGGLAANLTQLLVIMALHANYSSHHVFPDSCLNVCIVCVNNLQFGTYVGDMFTEEQNELVESAAEMLYSLIHVRYILTTKGMAAMRSRRIMTLEDVQEFIAVDSLVFPLDNQTFHAPVL